MPIYGHINTGFGGVNAAMGAEFARRGGITGMIKGSPESLDKDKEAQLAIILQKLKGQNELDVEGTRGKNSVGAIQATGKESRDTLTKSGEMERLLNDAQSSNRISEAEKAQVLGILTKANIPYSAETTKVYDKSTTDQKIRNEAQDLTNEGSIKGMPSYKSSLQEGMEAQNRAPVSTNFKNATAILPQGGTALLPPALGATPTTQLPILKGATQEQSIEQGPDFPGLPGSGTVKSVNQSIPPSFRVPVDPALMNKASNIPPPVSAAPPVNYDSTTPGIRAVPQGLSAAGAGGLSQDQLMQLIMAIAQSRQQQQGQQQQMMLPGARMMPTPTP